MTAIHNCWGMIHYRSTAIHQFDTLDQSQRMIWTEALRPTFIHRCPQLLQVNRPVAGGIALCAHARRDSLKLFSICLAPLAGGDKVRMLPCMHFYHQDCIDPWIMQKNHCPVCRWEILWNCFGFVSHPKFFTDCFYFPAPNNLQTQGCFPSRSRGIHSRIVKSIVNCDWAPSQVNQPFILKI